jgi:hypothetical protein
MIKPNGPLTLTLTHPHLETALQTTLHNWHPRGAAYDGLPDSLEEAAVRRTERLVSEHIPRAELPPTKFPHPESGVGYTFDLRLHELQDS